MNDPNKQLLAGIRMILDAYRTVAGERVAPQPKPRRPDTEPPVPEPRGDEGSYPTVQILLDPSRADRTVSLTASGSVQVTRAAVQAQTELRIYRTRAGGVVRVVCVVAAREKPAYLVGLRVLIDGDVALAYEGPFVLDPGQAWVQAFYVGGKAPEYWSARGRDLLRPVPDWAPSKLLKAYSDEQHAERIGPFQPGLPWDDGAAPGADYGVSTNGHETWLCPEGLALLALNMEKAAQRCRVFHQDSAGRPKWWAITGGQWMSWEPAEYSSDPEAALGWWPEYGRMQALKTYDDQHSARGWRSASVLKSVDPFAAWYLSHWGNRMALQWGQDHDDKNSLLRGMSAVLRRTKQGEGCESLGRAGLWAALLAQQASHPLERRFFELIRKASHTLTGEVMAVPRQWVPDANTGVIGPEELVGLTHEMAISVAVRRHIGCDTERADKLALLLVDTPGKCKVFGEDRWELTPLPYVELQAGDFSQYGGLKNFLTVCSTRSALGSDQPLLACPRQFWEDAL